MKISIRVLTKFMNYVVRWSSLLVGQHYFRLVQKRHYSAWLSIFASLEVTFSDYFESCVERFGLASWSLRCLWNTFSGGGLRTDLKADKTFPIIFRNFHWIYLGYEERENSLLYPKTALRMLWTFLKWYLCELLWVERNLNETFNLLKY
jgi:hypothetical protein